MWTFSCSLFVHSFIHTIDQQYALALQVTRMMQELSEYYQKLANGSDIFCIDTDVRFTLLSQYKSSCYKLQPCSQAACVCPRGVSQGWAPHPCVAYFSLPFLDLPCPDLPCPALPCPALPCPILPCPAILPLLDYILRIASAAGSLIPVAKWKNVCCTWL